MLLRQLLYILAYSWATYLVVVQLVRQKQNATESNIHCDFDKKRIFQSVLLQFY